MGWIPLEPGEGGEDEGDGARPKSAAGGNVRSFNLLRLREIANQRDQTAKSFEPGKETDSDDDDDDRGSGKENQGGVR